MIKDGDGRRRLYPLPSGLIREVRLAHPDYPGIEALELRWYSVPFVSDMILTIGGIDYPCAPFNGHYVSTEIACRDLVDPFRYDLVESVAAAMGLDPDDPLRKDRVLLELNKAVLLSFQEAGCTIVDHHRVTEQFITFAQREHSYGRIPSANWAWIVPPQAGSACATFHMPMRDLGNVPNFYRSRATDGACLQVNRETEQRSPASEYIDRINRRWRRWRKKRI